MSIITILLIVIVALLAGMEGVLDEFQFHQPLVACTLIGIVSGHMKEGIILGGSLQMMALGWANVGAAIAPDAALASVAKLPFQHAHDGISYTFAVSPATLGKERDIQIANMVGLLDGYFTPDGGQHLNVNVFDKELLLDAMEHPENYPQLTIRVSGYAVNFVKLTREQQLDVISRTINHSL